MVQTDISQLARECNGWRETLRSNRDELQQMQISLQKAVNHPLSKDEQTELEHLQNQLHIQLINVHDLKQAVKKHDRKLTGNGDESFSENISAYHESLFENYQSLESTLSELRGDLKHFVTTIQ